MRCFLLGEKLSHSISPELHTLLGGGYDYSLCEHSQTELGAFLHSDGFDALNVTVPYKKAVLPYISPELLSPTARLVENVNTVLRRGSSLYGYNTDFFGFSFLLDNNSVDVGGKNVLILGAGGAAETLCAVLAERKAAKAVTVARRHAVNFDNAALLCPDAEIIINATPVGMYPDNFGLPLSPLRFPRCKVVIDLIYNPAGTRFLLCGKDAGMKAVNGLDMLIAQAYASRRIFLGANDDIPVANERWQECYTDISRKLKAEYTNIVLIGMPSCGKTTVGKRLAQLTGRQFIDTDEMIERMTGQAPEKIILSFGEQYFRRLEKTALKMAARSTGSIVSVGGGAVLYSENRLALRQNGMIFYLDRSLGCLSENGRPISAASSSEELYRYRNPLYLSLADYTVSNDENPDDVARRILSLFYDDTCRQ